VIAALDWPRAVARLCMRALSLARPTELRTAGAFGAVVLLSALPVLNSPIVCPQAANPAAARGWDLYRADDLARAEAAFLEAVAECPRHVGARVGLGYVALRQSRLAEARSQWRDVLSDDRDNIDALVGLGILAWRSGDFAAVREQFLRVRALEPGNADAEHYLSRLPEEFALPPERPPLVLPESTLYRSRTHGEHFDVRRDGVWMPFYVKGVNIGAALPGRFPTEFPDRSTYDEWIAAIGALGANVVRAYTIHPPAFYDALREYNAAHPAEPLWLVHGAWTESPEGGQFDDAAWQREFAATMRDVVDLVHGRADIEPRPGHAGGHYVSDVSQWTLAYLVGSEWDPGAVEDFNVRRPDLTSWRGTYLEVLEAQATEVVLAQMLDEMVAYEMSRYREQRPVAWSNWPVLDPLKHSTEASTNEEAAVRRGLGEDVGFPPRGFNADAAGIDAARVRSTDLLPAGFYASYHVYPYDPDFLLLDPSYDSSSSSLGPSRYFGYVEALRRHHAGQPLLIAEYGVPASIGIAHVQPRGWHHGGHTEARMAELDARMTLEVAEAGTAGGIVFAWIDEWFKHNWLVRSFELPNDRARLWWNRMNPEQHYGLVAMEPIPPVAGEGLVARTASWAAERPLYAEAGITVRAAADAAYLWVHVQADSGVALRDVLIGFDVLGRESGDHRWPHRVGDSLPMGLEFVLAVDQTGARLLADPPYNPVGVHAARTGLPMPKPGTVAMVDTPPGFFSGRYIHSWRAPLVSLANDDGVYDSLRVLTNRARFGRDSTEFPAFGYDRGVLPAGEPPDGLWQISEARDVLEVRIPWLLLNVTDPSQRRVLLDRRDARLVEEGRTGTEGTVVVDGMYLVVARRARGGRWVTIPGSGTRDAVAMLSWDTWDEPRWRAYFRPAYDAVREAFGRLDTVLEGNGH